MDAHDADRPRQDEHLLDRAWAVRKAHFPPELTLAAPGAKRYQADGFSQHPHRFAAISLTGEACALRCAHCHGQLLKPMHAAPTPQRLRDVAHRLLEKGCRGVLLSGGADQQGRVPLRQHMEAIDHVKALGLQVIVHTGLVDRDTAQALAAAGVDQVLLDVIGDRETIRKVYHLDRDPADYAASLSVLKEAGLAIAPHLVIGLHFGRIRGEFKALEMITEAEPEAIVLVVLNPLPGTPMADARPPEPAIVGRLAATARVLNPRKRISLGCARPAGPTKVEMERLAIAGGINTLAYPSEGAIDYARSRSLSVAWKETCCSLL